MRVLQGKVTSGVGDYGRWIDKYRHIYRHYTGFDPYPGTLNVDLSHSWSLPPSRTHIPAGQVGVGVNVVPCRILGRAAYIVRTDGNEVGTGDHAKTTVEVLSDVRLRSHFNLTDGDTVEITVWD